MNFYTALSNGDGSIKEPHVTSLLYYLFRETTKLYPQNSFLNFFIQNILPQSNYNLQNIDPETDIKIEEIFKSEDGRKDTDITIYLKDYNFILNIENKISNSSYQPNQIAKQEEHIRQLNENMEVSSILILPFKVEIEPEDNLQIMYWMNMDESKSSLIDLIQIYIDQLMTEPDFHSRTTYFLNEVKYFFNAFGEILEQQILSMNQLNVRGPKTNYPQPMKDYLEQIAVNWDFPDPQNVTVRQLLVKFDEIVSKDLILNYQENALPLIERFRRGAFEAQPKIYTINEKNRLNFGNIGAGEKRLFYYPDFPDGNYTSRWKDTRITSILRFPPSDDIYTFTNR